MLKIVAIGNLTNDVELKMNEATGKPYHSYQHRLVDVYNTADENLKGLRIYRLVAQYGKEFNDYVDGESNFCSYYYQSCEIDARDYAESAVCNYYNRIREYLNGTSNGY